MIENNNFISSSIEKVNVQHLRNKYYIYNDKNNRPVMELLVEEGILYYLVTDRNYFIENKIKYSSGMTKLNDSRFKKFPKNIQNYISEIIAKMSIYEDISLTQEFKKTFHYNQLLLNITI